MQNNRFLLLPQDPIRSHLGFSPLKLCLAHGRSTGLTAKPSSILKTLFVLFGKLARVTVYYAPWVKQLDAILRLLDGEDWPV